MEFKLIPNPTFNREVELTTPEGIAKVPFVFRYKDSDALQAWFKAYKTKSTAEAFLEIIDSWGILGADNKPVDVSLSNLQQLFKNYPKSSSEILAAYHDALQGARAKNS